MNQQLPTSPQHHAVELPASTLGASEQQSLAAFDRTHIWHPYTKMPADQAPIPVVAASGVWLRLADGTKVIDAMSSWWTAAHGHSHPHLQQAALRQISTMSHVMFGGLTHPPAVVLAEHLCRITPDGLEKVFYSDSGSVAVEVALKMAYQYHMGTGNPQRNRILSFRGGYHGDTFATMSLCDPDGGMHSLWTDRVMENIFAPRPPQRDSSSTEIQEYLDQVASLVDEQIAALIIEPLVQGAGGMYFYDAAVLAGLREICDQHGILLIFDEIATGFGRTGELFASQTAGITPDILCIGKALTGGFMSFAATITTDAVASAASQPAAGGALLHGPTYMGNPLACAVAKASLELFDTGYWKDQVPAIATQLETALAPARELPQVAEVRVFGAIGVIEMRQPINMAQATSIGITHGVWLRPFGKLLYTMPPLISTSEDISAIAQAMLAIASAESVR